MTRLRLFCAIAAACTAVAFATPASATDAGYAGALRATAAQLDRAARGNATVPDVHVPPAPLGGPPRYSPSVDDWLQSALRAAQRQRSATRRAAAMRSVAGTLRYIAGGSAGAPMQTPRRDVAATARDVLAQPAYRAAATKPAPPPQPSIWERILDWIFRELAQLFQGLESATQGVPLLGDVFAIVLIGIALLGLAYVAFKIADRFAVRRRGAALTDGEALPANASADQLHAAARDAARDGNYARAIALLFQASLVVLDRAGRIAFDPARTAGEYRRLVRRKAEWIAGDFDSLARLFTAAAYADLPVAERDYAQAAAAFAGVGRIGAAR